MNIKDYPLSFYINKLNNDEYFSLGMYGDGEFQCIANSLVGEGFKKNCEGTLYTKELSEAMAESLKFKSDNFFFSACKMEGVDRMLKLLGVEIEFHEKDMWHKAMYMSELKPLIDVLKTKNLCIISNKMLRNLSFLNYDHFIEIDYPNCFSQLDEITQKVLDYSKEGVYLFACGIPATLFVQKLHGKISNSWFLDLGSIWDGFVGIGGQRPARRELYENPEKWKDWYKKNTGETREMPSVEWYGMGSKEIYERRSK